MDYTHPRAPDPLAALAAVERAQTEQARTLGAVLNPQIWRDDAGNPRVTIGPLSPGVWGVRVRDATGATIWEVTTT